MNIDNPSHPLWAGLKLSQRTRIAMAVRHIMLHGTLNRSHIMSFGEVSAAQAAADIRVILQRKPKLMSYDNRGKFYRLNCL